MARQLGRKIPKAAYDHGHFRAVVGSDGRTRYFPRMRAHYNRSRDVTPPPASVDWSPKASAVIAEMYLNNRYGDCVIASRYHNLGILTAAESGAGVTATDAEVYQTYQSACGRGDNGCDMSAVNQYRTQTGIVASGVTHKTAGSASVDHTNRTLVEVCLEVFGGLNVGLNLPQTWYQSEDGSDWAPVPGDPIVGGHEVQAFGYDDKGVWIATWGGKRRILWAAFTAQDWIDELYVELSPEWAAAGNVAPNGIDVAGLQAALAAVANGQVPPLPGPVTPPTPGPTPPVTPPTPPPPSGPFSGSLTYVNGVLESVGPAAAPGRRAASGFTFAGRIDPQQVTLPLPTGLLGGLQNVTLNLPAVTLSGSGELPAAAPHARLGSIDWAAVLALIEQYGLVVLPIVLSGFAAGKTWAQIAADVAAALLTPTAGRRGGCGGCAPQVSHVCRGGA